MRATVVHWHRREGGDRIARVRISDPPRRGSVEVLVPAAMPLPRADDVERWVERLVAELPEGERVDALVASSPLMWGQGRMSA